MTLYASTKRRLQLAVLAVLLAGPGAAAAGTIGFQIRTSVTTGPGVTVKVELKHTGDETARSVSPTVLLLGKEVSGAELESIGPGQTHSWSIDFQQEDLPAGVYTLITKVRYSDANAYPFEVAAATPFNVAATPRPPVRGTFNLPAVADKGTNNGSLDLTFPPERSGTFDVELVFPAGVHLFRKRFKVEPDAQQSAQISLRLTNKSLLAGTRINVFALVSSHEERSQTDLVQGVLHITDAHDPLTTALLVKVTVALAICFVVLQLTAWVREKRR